jgi:acyl-CoA synthetase (AMP-forming)/AMP-acid ligase II
MEADGLIRIVDRKKNLILRGGENLSATEIESIVQMHPDVMECAVVGVPDARYGERVAAFVVTEPGSTVTLDDLMKHFVAVGASRQKVPEYLELVDRLPRTGTGKLRKQDLRLTGQGPA